MKDMDLQDMWPEGHKEKANLEKRRFTPRAQFSAHILYNLTRPEDLLCTAPLARESGGYGLCKGKDPKGKDVFPDVNDSDYKTILEAMRDSKRELERIKRFDMPGFCPSPHYVREMKRYGILPADLSPDARVDVYATDQAYWRSLWYKPPGS